MSATLFAEDPAGIADPSSSSAGIAGFERG
jgi:hypothetical protein